MPLSTFFKHLFMSTFLKRKFTRLKYNFEKMKFYAVIVPDFNFIN